MKPLAVFLNKVRAGTIQQDASIRFTYDEHYLALNDPTPLSLSLPLQPAAHKGRPVTSWINGLLPADFDVRSRIAERTGVKATNPAALLSAIGLDCAGAVQVCDADRTDEVLTEQATLVPVDDSWISERLSRLRRDQASWQVADERWSLGGGQAKFALTLAQDGGWYDPRGSAASTHIFKTGVPTAKYQALNEHLCLEALRKVGLPTARTRYLNFAGQPASVVERFDRERTGEEVHRLHIEDLCQALANQTTYERYGGPTARQILELLGTHAGEMSRRRFVEALMCTYLIGAPDGHARNYSLYLRGRQSALAPLYDIASSLPYDVAGDGIMHLRKVAMSIGGERTFGLVGVDHWRRFFAANSVDSEWGFDALSRYTQQLPDAVADACLEMIGTDGIDELRDRFVNGVAWSCSRAIEALSTPPSR